jgi:transcription elongation factor GreA
MAGDPVIMTAEDLEALRAEVHDLETTERDEIAARIKTAREWGDLKENAEYHAAKEAQAHLETKIQTLNDRMRRAELREATKGDVVGFGSTVTVADENGGKESTYTLVSAVEADASAGKLSFESPMARALEGARTGDKVTLRTPKGERVLTVRAVG